MFLIFFQARCKIVNGLGHTAIIITDRYTGSGGKFYFSNWNGRVRNASEPYDEYFPHTGVYWAGRLIALVIII